MAWKMLRVAQCDVCGHQWIPQSDDPPLCPKKDCRSTLWNRGGVDGRTKAARKKKAGRQPKVKKL